MKNPNFLFKRKFITVISVLAVLSSTYAVSPKKSSAAKNKVITEKTITSPTKKELDIIADKIFHNEAGGVKNNLVYWNTGENFPSLGIGHFIWYKENEKGIFEESFPP